MYIYILHKDIYKFKYYKNNLKNNIFNSFYFIIYIYYYFSLIFICISIKLFSLLSSVSSLSVLESVLESYQVWEDKSSFNIVFHSSNFRQSIKIIKYNIYCHFIKLYCTYVLINTYIINTPKL